jgi:hypothetical protein
MPALELLRRIAVRITTSHQVARFTRGDCEQNARCALPPSDTWPVRAEQIARDGEYHPPLPMVRYPGVWPI